MKTKIILSILGLTLLISCNTTTTTTTVQVSNQITELSDAKSYMDGGFYNTRIMFYDENMVVIGVESIGNIKVGDMSDSYAAPQTAKYYKISFQPLNHNDAMGSMLVALNEKLKRTRFETVEYAVLQKGKNHYKFTDETITVTVY